MHFKDVQISNESMKYEWVPPLTEVYKYSALKVIMQLKYDGIIFYFNMNCQHVSIYLVTKYRQKRITGIPQLSAHHACVRIVPGVVADCTPVSIDVHLHSTLTQPWTIPQTHRVGKVTPCENRRESSVCLNHYATNHNLIPYISTAGTMSWYK